MITQAVPELRGLLLRLSVLALGLVLVRQDALFMAGLSLGVFLSALPWRGRTRGAYVAWVALLALCMSLLILSPTLWVDVLHAKQKAAREAALGKLVQERRDALESLEGRKAEAALMRASLSAALAGERRRLKQALSAARAEAGTSKKKAARLEFTLKSIEAAALPVINAMEARRAALSPDRFASEAGGIEREFQKKTSAELSKMPKPLISVTPPAPYSAAAALLSAAGLVVMFLRFLRTKKYN